MPVPLISPRELAAHAQAAQAVVARELGIKVLSLSLTPDYNGLRTATLAPLRIRCDLEKSAAKATLDHIGNYVTTLLAASLGRLLRIEESLRGAVSPAELAGNYGRPPDLLYEYAEPEVDAALAIVVERLLQAREDRPLAILGRQSRRAERLLRRTRLRYLRLHLADALLNKGKLDGADIAALLT